jgi:hypothetical protein
MTELDMILEDARHTQLMLVTAWQHWEDTVDQQRWGEDVSAKVLLTRPQQEHIIHIRASDKIRLFFDEAKIKMVEFARSLFKEEQLVLAAIHIFWAYLLCNDSIKVFWGPS